MKTKMVLLCSLAGLLMLPRCHRQLDCFCTEVFVMQMVQVMDESQNPIADVNLTVCFSDSGSPIDCSEYHDPLNGWYCILTDNYVGQLDGNGVEVMVIFEKPGFQTRIQKYLFNTDPCRCHINLLEGETVIVLLDE